MEAAGIACDGLTFLALAKGCEDGGLSQLASAFYDQAEQNGIDLIEHDASRRTLAGGQKRWKRKTR